MKNILLVTFLLALPLVAQEPGKTTRDESKESSETRVINVSDVSQIECDCNLGVLVFTMDGKRFGYRPGATRLVRSSPGYDSRHNRIMECLSILEAIRKADRIEIVTEPQEDGADYAKITRLKIFVIPS